MRFDNSGIPTVPGPPAPGVMRCQHCYSDVAYDGRGALCTRTPLGYLTNERCDGMPDVRHKPLPNVSADA